ncbi:MAG: LexA family protein [Carboxydocellales bacterium]
MLLYYFVLEFVVPIPDIKYIFEIENGQIAVVLVNGDEATLKRVKYLNESIILYPDNPKYEPQIYQSGEVRIIGRVVKVEFEP